MEGYFMVRKILCGSVTEVSKFWVPANVRLRKGKAKKTTERHQDENDRDGLKRLARRINCNFTRKDYFITLTYDDDGLAKVLEACEDKTDMNQVWSAADDFLTNFLRRLKRALGKIGVKPKIVAITADTEGDTGEVARIHHHLVISGKGIKLVDGVVMFGSMDEFKLWGFGGVDIKRLYNVQDYTPLAVYLWNQVRRQLDGKKYRPTRNLDKPVLLSEEKHVTNGELRVPKGGKLIHKSEYNVDAPQYMRYIDKKHQKSRADQQKEFDAWMRGA